MTQLPATTPPHVLVAALLTSCTLTGRDAAIGLGDPDIVADVLAAEVSGVAGDRHLAVTIESQETGCNQYADWWEVVTAEGALVYRRILAHSHADEQPFTRTGGPFDAAEHAELIVRAHMNPGGYGGQALRGTLAGDFTVDPDLSAEFAAELAEEHPLPDVCTH